MAEDDGDGPNELWKDSLKQVEARHQSKLQEAKDAYAAELAESDATAIAELVKMAKERISEGDLAGASVCWEAVLDVDHKNSSATAFFRTIGRLDVVRKKRKSGTAAKEKAESQSHVKTKFIPQNGKMGFELVGPNTYRHGNTTFKVELNTEYTLGLKAADGTRYRFHPDWYYGRKGDRKWVSWGQGKWSN